ncbi:hypothetical protein [Winogradskyella sp.]|uniref:hypothetical protein n=1 Tax=Winogradskyella sp. TaxID=1883156 RepID=UPI00260644FA|nr:hypothetical protein [Winogradskyella sp.]
MKVVIAHSSEKQIYRLAKSLESIGLNHVYITDYGFDALDYIVRHNCKICLLEQHLRGLNAKDIINAIGFKGIHAKFIILGVDDDLPLKLNRNVLASIDLKDEDALLQILALVEHQRNGISTKNLRSYQ